MDSRFPLLSILHPVSRFFHPDSLYLLRHLFATYLVAFSPIIPALPAFSSLLIELRSSFLFLLFNASSLDIHPLKGRSPFLLFLHLDPRWVVALSISLSLSLRLRSALAQRSCFLVPVLIHILTMHLLACNLFVVLARRFDGDLRRTWDSHPDYHSLSQVARLCV